MWRSYFLLAALTAGVHPVTGYSNGRVSVACGDMVPQHGYKPSPDPHPYSITVDKTTFSPRDKITVSLQVASSNTTFFRGFLIEARDAGKLDSPALGFFLLTDPHESQLLQCGHAQGSGVSHRRSTRKTCVQVVWIPPEKPPQRVQFLVTVVHEYKVYWVRTAGPEVSLKKPTAVPPTAVPPSAVPPTAVPPTAVPPSAVPPSAVPPTAVPPTAVPPSAVPPTAVPPSAVPPTAVPPTAVPPTAVPPSAVPPTAVPPSAVPPTAVPPTAVPPSAVPPSAVPPTAVPPTAVPPSAVPPTAVPPSAVPPTAVPPTAVPPSAVPPTAVPPSAVPPSAVPPTAVPPSAVPPTAVPPSAVPPTAVPPTAVPAQTISSATALFTPFSSVGCGHSKSCLRDPVGCHPESDPHCFFLSFIADRQGRTVTFELSGSAEGYVSLALSLDGWMGDDAVYLCVNDGGRVSISAGYVSGRTHPELAAQDDLWGRAWRLADGVIQCRFQRNTIHPQVENSFNLNHSYFLFLAHGRAQQGLIQKHDRQPLMSTSQKVITGHPEDLPGSRSPFLIKCHGVLMMTVWMWTVSAAIFIAHHYKHFWPDTTLLGQRLWFQLHQTMMGLAVVLTSVAFSLPFIYRRGWSTHAGSHPFIGCTVMALSVIQVIMAVLRPAPESPRRIIFSWMHFGTGTAVQILAVGCVFLGASQQALGLPGPQAAAALAGWLLWIVLANLLLIVRSHRLRRRANINGDDDDIVLSAQLERQQRGEMSQVKTMVLVVFLVGNTGFLAAFIASIASV